ncbi:hypothetical protein K2X85_10810 [bacterium]|nr:hypothetical protein [bacterium]
MGIHVSSRRWAVMATALALLSQNESWAHGFGKKKQDCETCPTVIQDGSSALMPTPTDGSSSSTIPSTPAMTIDTSDSISDALAGQYDVASGSGFAAPNMVGDFFGTGGTSLIALGSEGVGYDSFGNVTGYNRDTPGLPAGASPGTGGTVGRVKFSDNTSIVPTDRVYFGYQFFDNTRLSPGGTDVSRFVPGFEKTFFGGKTSVEVRIPFASTLDSTQQVGAIGGTNTELGNVTLFFKSLLYTTNNWAVGAGLTVTTPTADDTVIRQGSSELIRIKNQGTHLAPYLGVVYSKCRLFSQLYMQYDVDATGRDVFLRNSSNQFLRAGSLSDESVFFVDWNVGYWIYRNTNSDSLLTGIAPVFEIHYNQGLGNSDWVANDARIVGSTQSQFSIINLTAGSHFLLGQRSMLTLAAVVPVTDGARGRQFDFEFQVLFNYVFGKTNQFNRLPSLF